MSKKHTILMGDVVGSSELDADLVQQSLKTFVQVVNETYTSSILSPLTITLGDEFQGVCADAVQGVELLLRMERIVLEQQLPFRMHFVLLEGEIDTEINSKTAYGMLGKGLTEARELLSSKKRDRRRFELRLNQPFLTTQLNRLFEVLDALSHNWKPEDYALIVSMLEHQNNQTVADLHQKNRAQIWKRRNTLQIETYQLTSAVISDLINEYS
jgi:hypothetical protein